MHATILLCTLAALVGLPVGYGYAALLDAIDAFLSDGRWQYVCWIETCLCRPGEGGGQGA